MVLSCWVRVLSGLVLVVRVVELSSLFVVGCMVSGMSMVSDSGVFVFVFIVVVVVIWGWDVVLVLIVGMSVSVVVILKVIVWLSVFVEC